MFIIYQNKKKIQKEISLLFLTYLDPITYLDCFNVLLSAHNQ